MYKILTKKVLKNDTKNIKYSIQKKMCYNNLYNEFGFLKTAIYCIEIKTHNVQCDEEDDKFTVDDNLINKKNCEVLGCKFSAVYHLDAGLPTRCLKHKTKRMELNTEKLCFKRNCNNYATYCLKVFTGQRMLLCCSDHKRPDMVELLKSDDLPIDKYKIKRFCEVKDCNTRSTYNFKGLKPLRCKTHIINGMKDVVSPTCLECDKQPAFNFQNEKKGIYCFEHKKQGMVNIKDKTCLDCDKQPSFNYQNETIRLYCKDHAKEGMVDINHKRCLDCGKRPNFNYPNETMGIYCKDHAKNKMVDIKNKRCLDCNKQPYFNFQNETTRLYCNFHKKQGMKDVLHKTCLADLCDTQVKYNKYQGYCFNCFKHLFPDSPLITRNHKTKEQSVVEYVKEQFPNYTWVADKRIENGCSNRRPDLLLDMGSHVIIVEIDEDQHKTYDTTCEVARINELFTDLQDRPIVFIRFNPDKYTDDNGIIIKSCWSQHKTNNSLMIKSDDMKAWNKRLNTLFQCINQHINTIPTEPVNTEYLYFTNAKA